MGYKNYVWSFQKNGLEHSHHFQPGDGVFSSMLVMWSLKGPRGAVVFEISTGWDGSNGERYPFPAVMVHSLEPQYKGDTLGKCALFEKCCSSLRIDAGKQIMSDFMENGESAIWDALTEIYFGISFRNYRPLSESKEPDQIDSSEPVS